MWLKSNEIVLMCQTLVFLSMIVQRILVKYNTDQTQPNTREDPR